MSFDENSFEKLFPKYLVATEKTRLREALKQFSSPTRNVEINYDNFYKRFNYPYFLQSDLIREVRFPYWDESTQSYEKGYINAIIISNSCDISSDNPRDKNVKECLFAPLINFSSYLNELENLGYNKEQLESFEKNIKAQQCSNLVYLPYLHSEKSDYIASLDKIFWFPTSELNSYIDQIDENRISSLDRFGHYLFVLKLSYHMCRLPEECDRA